MGEGVAARGAAPEVSAAESGFIDSGEGRLYCLLRRGAPGAAAGTVLLPPLGDERKSSLRAYVEAAEELARAGISALRIDYRGTGDSTGESSGTALAAMVEDAASAAAHLREREGCARVALAGLRLGASVAVLASDRARADALFLLEPVVSGGPYVRELERRRALRRMLTRGRGDAREEEDQAGEVFDLDGLALSRSFLEELRALELAAEAGNSAKTPVPALVVQYGARRSDSPAPKGLAEALPGARLEVAVAEPFWLQTDYVSALPAIRLAREFLAGALASDESLRRTHG